MDSDTDSDLLDESDTYPCKDIIVTCEGDGKRLPALFDVCVSTENTTAGFKETAILTAQVEGYKDIDPRTMRVTLFYDDMEEVIRAEDIEWKKYPTQPSFALLITHVSKKIA